MNSEHPQEVADQPVSADRQTPSSSPDSQPTKLDRQPTEVAQAAGAQPSANPSSQQATILVRGETIRDRDLKSAHDTAAKDGKNPPTSKISETKAKMQSRLPALDDDADVGVQKEQVVTRDGKADLAFTGTLIASAAPPAAPKGEWQEYRIYETNAGKHVFSKVTRTVSAEEEDTHEAEVFDPSPSSVPSQLMRSARELTRSRPLQWTDAAVAFFGYDPLAKTLYRKLGSQFEEHIT